MDQREQELRDAVASELAWDIRLRSAELAVGVDGGVVELTGAVAGWAERQAAQDAAHRVRGVLDVVNAIQVRRPPATPPAPAELARALRDALCRELGAVAARIHTTLADGQAALEGSVDAWAERERAEQAAWQVPGISSIQNRLEVCPRSVPSSELRGAIASALEREARREAERLQLRMLDGRVTLSGVVRSWSELDAVVGAVRNTPGVRSVESCLSVRRLRSSGRRGGRPFAAAGPKRD